MKNWKIIQVQKDIYYKFPFIYNIYDSQLYSGCQENFDDHYIACLARL